MVAAWVAARRNVYTVVLTDQTLRQGGQSLPTSRIAAVLPEAPDGGGPSGPVLGGGLVVPRKTTEVPVRLDDPQRFLDFGEQVAAGDIETARAMLASYEGLFDTARTVLPDEPDFARADAWLVDVRRRLLST